MKSNTKLFRNLGLSLFGATILGGCASQSLEEQSFRNENIRFSAQDLFPEGVAYDKKTDTIYVSSMKRGSVGTVSINGGNAEYREWLNEPDLISTSGLSIDSDRRRLYVANVDVGASVKTAAATQQKLAGLAVYDLDSKKRLAYLELQKLYSGGHFANETALAEDGTAYVSDSFSPVIYRVSPDLQDAEVFIQDERFAVGEGFNLNGMAVYGSEAGSTLFAVKYNSGELFAIDIATKNIEKIALPENVNIHGADGLELYHDRFLVTAHNDGNDGITILQLGDDMRSIVAAKSLENLDLDFPTTIAADGKHFYILNAALSTMFGGKSKDVFSLLKLEMKQR